MCYHTIKETSVSKTLLYIDTKEPMNCHWWLRSKNIRVGPMEFKGETSLPRSESHTCSLTAINAHNTAANMYIYITQAGQWIRTVIVWEVSHETSSKFINISSTNGLRSLSNQCVWGCVMPLCDY